MCYAIFAKSGETVEFGDLLSTELVIGQPGAGETTFLRRIAYALCQTHLGDVPKAAEQRLGIRDRTFPVFVRINELAQHPTALRRAFCPGGRSGRLPLPHG